LAAWIRPWLCVSYSGRSVARPFFRITPAGDSYAMKRRDMLISTAALGLSQLPLRWAFAADAPKRKLLFFTKSGGFEHPSIRRNGDKPSHADQVLMDLGKQHNFEVVCSKDGDIFNTSISSFDAFFFQTQGDLLTVGVDKQQPLSADGKKRLLDAVAAEPIRVTRQDTTPASSGRPKLRSIRTSPWWGASSSAMARSRSRGK